MVKKTVIGSLFIIAMALASWNVSALEVKAESLEWGQCWVGQEDGKIKLTSFGNGKSFVLSPSHWAGLQEELLPHLRESRLDEKVLGLYKVYLQCRPNGAFLFINLMGDGPQLCVHLEPTRGGPGETRLVLTGVFPNHEGGKGFCEGQAAGGLLVAVGGGSVEEQECRRGLRENFSQVISEIREEKSFVFVQLSPEYHFKEKWFKETLLQDKSCSGVLSPEKIEYNSLRLPPGQIFKIKEGDFSKEEAGPGDPVGPIDPIEPFNVQ